MFGFDPVSIGVGVLVWLAFRKQSGTQFGVMTTEREELFRNAMAHCADPAKLQALSKIFQDEGLKAEALMLKRRAEWRARTPAEREAHQKIFEQALGSTNVQAILGVAQAFDAMTATFKGQQLRTHAQAVQEAALKKDTVSSPAPVSEPAKEPEIHEPEIVSKPTNGKAVATPAE